MSEKQSEQLAEKFKDLRHLAQEYINADDPFTKPWGDGIQFACDALSEIVGVDAGQVARLEAQVEAYRQFAQHKHWCRNIQAPAGAPCDCGLQELLEASDE